VDKTIVHQSLTVFYRDEADSTARPANPVILIHGFAEDGAIWDQQVAFLKKDYRLIVPDLPGSGRSSPLTVETTVEQLADNIKAILDAESIRQCIMIGHSLGGYITLAFAEQYPERLKAIGLFHSTAYGDTAEKKTARSKSIEFIRKNGSAPFIRQSTPNLFSETSRKENPGFVTRLIDRYANFDPDSLIQYYEAMIKRPDRTSVLANFAEPVLFIIGKQDNAVPFEQSLRQSHMPALSHIYILENAGHAGMLEDSAGSNQALHDFLQFTEHSSFNIYNSPFITRYE
jgi:pimeloyl-ACP methyl ester carboxylesterase